MIIEFEINGARVIVSGENLSVSVTQDDVPVAIPSPRVTGKPLKEWLKENGLLLKEFSPRVGASYVFLSRIMNGHQTPGAGLIRRIEKATGGEVNYHSWFPREARITEREQA